MEGTRTEPTRMVVGGASLDTPERTRAYQAAVQRDLNVFLQRLGSPTVLAVDGEWDSDTQLAFERVCRILGIDAVREVRTYRLIGGAVADRTDAELERAKSDGAAFAQQLKTQFATAGNGSGSAAPSLPAKDRKRTVVGGRSLEKALVPAPTRPRCSATSTAI
jgi:hypothetical protein